MKKIKYLIFLGLVFAQVALAQPPSTHIYKSVEGRNLDLDIYQPDHVFIGKRPVIVFYHGGALVAGSKKQMEPSCVFFAKRGFVCVTVNYRLVIKDSSSQVRLVQTQQAIMDCKSALRWVKAHGDEFNIDTNRVVISGGSAGGFLATEVALNDDINTTGDDMKISTKVQAMVLFNPAYTPAKKYAPAPLQYISANTPPAIFFYGDQDDFRIDGKLFRDKISSYKIKTEFWIAKGQIHGFQNRPGWVDATNAKAYNFLIGISSLKINGKPENDVEGFMLDLQ